MSGRRGRGGGGRGRGRGGRDSGKPRSAEQLDEEMKQYFMKVRVTTMGGAQILHLLRLRRSRSCVRQWCFGQLCPRSS